MRLLLQPRVTRDEFRRLALQQDWIWQDTFERTDDAPFESVWSASDNETAIRYIEDFLLDATYVCIEGPATEAVSEALTSALAVESLDEVLSSTTSASTPADRARIAGRVAVASPAAPDRKARDFLAYLLGDDSPEVRRATILAVGYLGWPDFISPLTQLAEMDPERDVRAAAARMLAGLEEQIGEGAG